MENESPIMKAWREFAMADPEDCDQEWEAYLALTRTTSASSSTTSTSSVHSRAGASAATATATSASSSTARLREPRDAAHIANPTATAASRAVLSAQHDSPKGDLSPEAHCIYDYLIGNSAAPPSTTSPPIPSSAISTTSPAVAASVSTSTCDSRPATKDDLTPGARRIYNLIAGGSSAPASAISEVSTELADPTTLNLAPTSVDMHATDLATPAPTTCSSECPSKDVCASVSVTISSATPTSSMTTGGVSEQCCFDPEPAAAISTPTSTLGLLEGGDDFTSMSPSICLILCSSGGIGTVGSEACSINLVQAPGASTSILRLATYLLDDVDISKRSENVLPPWFVSFQDVNMCKDMLQALLLDGLVLQSMQLMLWAGKYRWPPPVLNMGTGIQNILLLDCQDIPFMPRTTSYPLHVGAVEFIRSRIGIWLCCFGSQGAEVLVFCFAACSNSNLHGTMDIMQITGDLHFLRTVEIEWNATLVVIIFATGALSVQLQPTVFRWSDPSHNIHLLSASTLDFLLVRRDAQIVWNLCCLDNLHGFFESTNWALEEEKEQLLLSIPWSSFRCHRVAAYLTLLWKLPTGHSHEDPNGFAGSFVLHRTSFSDENEMHLVTAAETSWCTLFSIEETGACLESEHLLQWRPPDQVTSLACMCTLFLRFKDCWSDIHWAQPTIAFFDDLHHERHTTEYLEVHNLLYRLTSTHFLAELIVIEHWLIPWEPGNDSLCHNLMENFTSLSITCELFYSISVDDKLIADCYWLWCVKCACPSITCEVHYSISVVESLLAARYWVWWMSCLQLQLDTDMPSKCVIFLQPKPPWSYLCPTSSIGVDESMHIVSVYLEAPSHGNRTYGCLDIERKLIGQQFKSWPMGCYYLRCPRRGLLYSCDQIVIESATYFDSQYFEWKIPWYNCDKEFLESFLLAAHPPPKALHFPWDRGDCFASAGSQDNLVRVDDGSYCPRIDIRYINTYTCWECGPELMTWEIARSEDDSLTCTKQVLLSWNPGGSTPVLVVTTDSNWNSTQLKFLYLTWDPDGYTLHRLEGKPNFKKGGLSATSLLGWSVGRHSWAVACSRATREGNIGAYIPGGHLQRRWLGTKGRNGGLGRGLAWPVSVACYLPNARCIDLQFHKFLL